MNFPSEKILRIAIAFIAALGIGVATYIFISDSTSGAPACLAGGTGCETVAKSSYSHIAGINVAIFGIIGWVLILAPSSSPTTRRDWGLHLRARRLRLQHLPHVPGDLEDRSDLPVVRVQRGADDDRLPAQCDAFDRLRGHRRYRVHRQEPHGRSPKTAEQPGIRAAGSRRAVSMHATDPEDR